MEKKRDHVPGVVEYLVKTYMNNATSHRRRRLWHRDCTCHDCRLLYSPWTNGGCLGPCLALTKKVCIFETANLKRREVIVTIPNNDVRLGTESEHAVQYD